MIVLKDWRTYSMMMSGGALGAAEAYMEKGWDSPDLVRVVRFFAANINAMKSLESGLARLSKPALALLHRHNRNSLQGSRRNIAAHYDLGNDFFALFLDRTMMYSSAIFPSADTSLEDASEYKMEQICQRLELQAGDVIAGSGYRLGRVGAARGTPSWCACHDDNDFREQARYAREQVARAGLTDRITILEKDYRELEGQYDSVVSVEMIEAVGAEFLPGHFRMLGERLKPDRAVAVAGDYGARPALRSCPSPGGFYQALYLPGWFPAQRFSDVRTPDAAYALVTTELPISAWTMPVP